MTDAEESTETDDLHVDPSIQGLIAEITREAEEEVESIAKNGKRFFKSKTFWANFIGIILAGYEIGIGSTAELALIGICIGTINIVLRTAGGDPLTL